MLTVKKIETAKSAEKAYRLADQAGLFLYVPPSGKKVWRMRYRYDGKEKTLVIGPYPQITLLEARLHHAEAKAKLLSGIDPAVQKKTLKQGNRELITDTLSAIFEEWHAHKSQTWSPGYRNEMSCLFQKDILPVIGHLRISEIEPMALLNVIRIIESRGAMATAEKALSRCGEVFSYAVVTGRARFNPVPDLKGALVGYTRKNHPFLSMDLIHNFNRALSNYKGSYIFKVATQLLHYTAMRTIELRTLRWENVDYDNQLLHIDPAVMKGRRIHIVPMSRQVTALLRSLESHTGQYGFVFPGKSKKDQPASDNTILGVISKIGYKGLTCGHGFRHQFSTVMNEYKWHHDAIEVQLAHVIRETRGVYNHAKYLSTRREIMQWWADWLDEKHSESDLAARLAKS